MKAQDRTSSGTLNFGFQRQILSLTKYLTFSMSFGHSETWPHTCELGKIEIPNFQGFNNE